MQYTTIVVGLGRMGAGVAWRLQEASLLGAVYNRSAEKTTAFAEKGVAVLSDIASLASVEGKKLVWLALPAGETTTSMITELTEQLSQGDVVVDSANQDFSQTLVHSAMLSEKGITFVDCGISGGIRGAKEGYCLMVGGEKWVVDELQPLWAAIAQQGAFAHAGGIGAGHFSKMVHNAIEYGMMQAMGEGLELLSLQKQVPAIDLAEVLGAWRYGSVVRSFLADLAHEGSLQSSTFEGVSEVVADSGEGRWALREAIAAGVATPVLAASLSARFFSQGSGKISARVQNTMRLLFGGHKVS